MLKRCRERNSSLYLLSLVRKIAALSALRILKFRAERSIESKLEMQQRKKCAEFRILKK